MTDIVEAVNESNSIALITHIILMGMQWEV